MKFSKILLSFFSALYCGCTTPYTYTVSGVNIDRYMGRWYVIANRPTIFEEDAYSATESYTMNKENGKIDVDFRYKKGSFDGPEKSMPQTAWVYNKNTNAHLKISLWWLPFNMDYLIIALDKDYQWTVVGVPDQKYLWVMSREPYMADVLLFKILEDVKKNGYDISSVNRVPQQEIKNP